MNTLTFVWWTPIYEPLPNRFAYIMARGWRNLGRHAFLCVGEPFCHQTGPYQTLRAENWWSQLLVRFLIFFLSRNHLNDVQQFRDVLFLWKKGPCQECTTQKSGVGMVTRIQISRYPDIQISRCPDVRISRYQVSDTRYQVSGIRKISENHKNGV